MISLVLHAPRAVATGVANPLVASLGATLRLLRAALGATALRLGTALGAAALRLGAAAARAALRLRPAVRSSVRCLNKLVHLGTAAALAHQLLAAVLRSAHRNARLVHARGRTTLNAVKLDHVCECLFERHKMLTLNARGRFGVRRLKCAAQSKWRI